jgi:heavy metal sensor kinase
VPLSLRARLTAWYSVLLLLTVAAFSAAVLWIHWQLLLQHFDDSLETTCVTADNVVDEELGETHDLERAAREMAEVVRPANLSVEVLDGNGRAVRMGAHPLPRPSELRPKAGAPTTQTIDADGKPWRISVRGGSRDGIAYRIAVGAPLDEVVVQWRALLKASAIGIPLVLAFAIGGGWLLGRHGLRPLTTMAAEAEKMTAATPESRLTVPASGEELARLAGAFNHVLERLGSALSTQRQFMADASHELRTPVSIMRTAADVTLSRPAREEIEYREALGAVAHQSSRLARLVDDMLVLARADGGGYPMVAADVDLGDLAADCVRDLASRAGDKSIRVTSSLEPVVVVGDEALLRRMLANLLLNALIYTPSGGAVDVSVSRQNGHALLRVADTGPGISPQDWDRVFQRFVRLDPARAAGGAGLGLAIARWVAQAHGGNVSILSSSPSGSTFSATLPLEHEGVST